MERPNLGKFLVSPERDVHPYTRTSLPPNSSYPMVTSAVTIPRQLAPTVGPGSKGVYITGEALRGMRRLALDRKVDWNPKSNQAEVCNMIPFGKINVFVGMVRSSELGLEDSSYESGLEAAASDGEEAVGTADLDLPAPAQGVQLEGPIWMPSREVEEDEESIQELLEDRYGYGLEDEQHELYLEPIRRVGVYTTPATNLNPESVSAAVTAAAETLAQDQQNQQNWLIIHNPSQVDGAAASVSSESEAAARRMNQFGFLLNRPAGENTAATPNPASFGANLVLDSTILEAEITPKNAIIRARELDTARRILEQQQKEFAAEKERILARQRQLDER